MSWPVRALSHRIIAIFFKPTNAKVLRRRLEQRVLLGLGGFAGAEWRGGGLLAGSGLGLGLVMETSEQAAKTNLFWPAMRSEL
jgi:hypothetical protein